MPPSAQVVVSYARKDSGVVRRAVAALRARAVDLWIDVDDIALGDRWQGSIERAIDECTHVLVFVSSNSIGSAEVEAEWSLALSLGRTLIPILIEDVALPFRLRMFQGMDISGDQFNPGIERLAMSLPQRTTPSHWLAEDEDTPVPIGYTAVGMPGDRTALLDPERFTSVGHLLDTVFMEYLQDHCAPYMYGRDWYLRDLDMVIAPVAWMTDRRRTAREVAPGWMGKPPYMVGLWPQPHRRLQVARVDQEETLTGVVSERTELLRELSWQTKALYMITRSPAVDLGQISGRRDLSEAVFRFPSGSDSANCVYLIDNDSPVTGYLH